MFWPPDAHLGVVGIVASRLVERLGALVIVLTEDPKEPGVLAGSGRSIPGFHLLEALESMAHLFLGFGGHSQAAGVRLRYNQFDDFRSRFGDYTSQWLGKVRKHPSRSVDAEVSFRDLTLDLAKEIQLLEPFGCGNPVPVFLARNVRIAGPIQTLTPGKHFMIPLAQEGHALNCKAWNFSEHIEFIRTGTPVDILFRVDCDDYSARRGGRVWMVTVRDVRLSQDGR